MRQRISPVRAGCPAMFCGQPGGAAWGTGRGKAKRAHGMPASGCCDSSRPVNGERWWPRPVGGWAEMAEQTDSVATRLQSALDAHDRGDLDAARKGYDAVLHRVVDHPDALHLLGVIADQQGRPERSE